MRGVVAGLRHCRSVVTLLVFGMAASGCVSTADGPTRLYPVEVETQFIRENLKLVSLDDFSRSDETQRVKYRNDWIAARMYAIDIQYTTYEAALTKERQNVGFGAAAATLGLTTASGLLTPVATKNVLTGLAGFVTGTRAAYDNDVLLAHSVQWVQSQMRTQRSIVAERILRGMRASTVDYPLAAALSDLEDYYRAGTFTGGMLGTSEALGAEARFAEQLKQDRIEVNYVSTATGRSLRACYLRKRPGVTQAQQRSRLIGLMTVPDDAGFLLLVSGKEPALAEELLRRATAAGICP